MLREYKFGVAFVLSVVAALICSPDIHAQTEPQGAVFHRIEGRIQYRTDGVGNLRVRLLHEMRPITETFSRPEGQFTFNMVREGDYIIETFETDKFEASSTSVLVRPLLRQRPDVIRVFVELQLRPPPDRVVHGVVAADVDLKVPKNALKHYRAGMKFLDQGESAVAIKEFQAAVELYDQYYAARLQLGHEFRAQRRYEEAAQILRPLAQIAPRRAAPRVETAAALLALGRQVEAIEELRIALALGETNWEAHFYLGWALLETEGDRAEPHLRRSLELDERKAARAYLALARLAHSKGQRQIAIGYLNTFLKLAPESEDAEAARKLVEQLTSSSR